MKELSNNQHLLSSITEDAPLFTLQQRYTALSRACGHEKAPAIDPTWAWVCSQDSHSLPKGSTPQLVPNPGRVPVPAGPCTSHTGHHSAAEGSCSLNISHWAFTDLYLCHAGTRTMHSEDAAGEGEMPAPEVLPIAPHPTSPSTTTSDLSILLECPEHPPVMGLPCLSCLYM